jgi:acyl-[acyl-carrier-protein]-phospholipid O-acyltransferase/long-chain-fatty-acid--[acyl-carrier-protein] ligase
VEGLRCFQYPSPLHYKIVPELVYDTDATIIFSTNTFLNGYAHQAHPFDFHTLRYVFAGAEPLSEQTEKLWMEKFGIRILQGYGVTETSPVLAANTLLTNRRGSVGRFVPGVDYRLIDVPGINQGKRLQVKGLNIMKGYLLPGQPGEVKPPVTEEWGEGWYDTGDIVSVDSDGYVFIRGRAKRFAKIGGEMVSLTAVENMIGNAWPDSRHAVISLPDRSKGEQLVLFTEYADASRKALVAQVKKEGLSELLIPKKIEVIEKLSILPSGKIDYATLMDENDAKK